MSVVPERKSVSTPVIAGIAAGVLVLLVVGCGGAGLAAWLIFNPKEPTATAQGTTQTVRGASDKVPLSPVKPDFVVDMREWKTEWYGNTPAAKIKYVGKYLQVSGTVMSVIDGEKKTAEVNLQENNPPSSTPFPHEFRCIFTNSADVVHLKPGDKINVVGKLNEHTSLLECRIVP